MSVVTGMKRWNGCMALLLLAAVALPSRLWAGVEESLVRDDEHRPGQITLPLERYEALLREIDRVAAQKALDSADQEEAIAEITRLETEMVVSSEGAVTTHQFEVVVTGRELSPVVLPVNGLVTSASSTPLGASLSHQAGSVILVAQVAGLYSVAVEAFQAFGSPSAALRSLPLLPSASPVGSTTVRFDADLRWECRGATLVREEVTDAAGGGRRRTIELVLPRDRVSVLQLRQRFSSSAAEQAVVHATTATVLNLQRYGVGRTDLASFDVARGSVSSHRLRLPEGLDPEVVRSDEGEALSERNDRELIVYRSRQLEGAGSVILETPILRDERVNLTSIETDFEERGHYLIVKSGFAARATPQPAGHWSRRDGADLPRSLAAVVAGDVVAVWQLNEGRDPGHLVVERLTEASDLGAVVRRRESTSLLTVDGSLVHREVLTVVGRGSALEVNLPEGSELWSMSLDGVPSRPLQRNGLVYVPLPLANDSTTEVELVSVQTRAVPDRRSTIDMQLAKLSTPVLEHRWQVLLPEGKQYRYSSGSLKPSIEDSLLLDGLDAGQGTHVLRGRVQTGDGDFLPGVTVTVETAGGTLTQTTNASGWYTFQGLPPGRHKVMAKLPGFGSAEASARLAGGRTTFLPFQLEAAVYETITVTSEAPLLDEREVQEIFLQDAAEIRQQNFAKEVSSLVQSNAGSRDEVSQLEAGQVSGVRPLPVSIPERGKVLMMVGVLPEGDIRLVLDVKERRRR